MNVKYNHIIIFSLFLSILGCATYQKQINEPKKAIQTNKNVELEHRFYLIGDAGYSEKNKENLVFKQLTDSISLEKKSTTVLFLGDNIYPKGMPTEQHKNRKKAEKALQNQIDIVKNFNGRTIFIPGNHDWYSNGVKGLKRQENFVEDALWKKTFLPENGCPIEKINVSENIVLLIVDSQWYITNWDNQPTINDDCFIKSKSQFLGELQSEIKKAEGKTTLIAIHHPIFTNGPHGGKYAFKDHLKPFPILGTLKNLIRSTSGIANVDISNILYNDLRKKITAMAKQNEKVVFVSGHEHSLQYIVQEEITQIISGSASKKTPTRLPKNHQFSYGENGYAVLDVFKDGSSSVRFITPEKVEYQTIVFKAEKKGILKNSIPKIQQDSIAASIYTKEEITKNNFQQFLWGERFRASYGVPVKAPVVYLDTFMGGLTPFRKGGGNQSKTLHLKDKNGTRYVIRAMKKEASQYLQSVLFKDEYLQPELENTKTAHIVKDVFTGSYPFATLITGTLSEAIGVPHLNPQLFYIPKQNALHPFNEEFGDELYILEEHPSEGHLELGGEKFTGEIISTEDMLAKIMTDESIIIDQEAYIRARLFDMLIGDWDRHQDQWRWMKYKENGQNIYRPLPRDRDQAFSRMSDGFLLGAAVRLIPAAKLIRKYEPNIKSVKSFNFEPLPLDITVLENLDKNSWLQQTAFIQQNITDEVIDNAFKNVPKELQNQNINEIKKLLKARRKNLTDITNRYFDYLSSCRIIRATNKDDYILVKEISDKKIAVEISRIINGEKEAAFYKEEFDTNLTKELWIYGLDDVDTFEVKGAIKKIRVRLIGGQNNDTYKIENGRNITIYDFKSKNNNLSNAKKATIKLRDDYELNTFDYKKHKYSLSQLLPTLGYNPDEGFVVGANFTHTTFGFERNPFTSQHRIGVSYFTASSGFEIKYNGEFANIFNHVNFVLNSSYTTPKFGFNFFGIGNETQNNEEQLGNDFYRTLLEQFVLNPSLQWKSYGGVEVSAGFKYNSIKVENTPNRVLDGNNTIPNDIFKTQHFGTINAIFNFENFDNKTFPTMGIKTRVETGFTQNLNNNERNFIYLIPEISFDYKLIPSGKLVFATHLKNHFNFSNDFEYYQGATIGGNNGLRGFRNERFTGKNSFFQSSDIRYAMGSLKNNVIPMQYGFYLGFDYGRVWVENESSDKWHHAQGGGMFLNVAGKLASQIGLFTATDGLRLNFTLGFDF